MSINEKLETLSLTDNESKLLDNLRDNNYSGGAVWSWALAEGPHGQFVPRSSMGGIVSSLVKKGMVTVEDYDASESVVSLTQMAREYLCMD